MHTHRSFIEASAGVPKAKVELQVLFEIGAPLVASERRLQLLLPASSLTCSLVGFVRVEEEIAYTCGIRICVNMLTRAHGRAGMIVRLRESNHLLGKEAS